MTNISCTAHNGSSIPSVGLGTYKSEPGQIKIALQNAIQSGYRHFDLAAFYQNESEIGDCFKEIFSEGLVKREDLWITSKLWNSEHRPERVENACRKTLSDLKLDYLDLYLIHWPMSTPPELGGIPKDSSGRLVTDSVPIHKTWEAMEELVKKGLVRNIGVCNFVVPLLEDLWNCATIKPMVNQVEMHPFCQLPELVKYCEYRQICLTAFCPIARPGSHPQFDVNKSQILLDISKAHNKTPAQVALRWNIQRSRMISVIPKSVTPSRIKENIDIGDFTLSDDEMRQIETLDRTGRVSNPNTTFGFAAFN
ncbi:putative Aldo-keto reductase family 1 member A1 [Blattamonas nauphoetae]|uniref:Aldo-keto reductase family 1 member A1 n=1 Tax=Blattamonas nauphoetae TaxID=2049346 RepID=A0ABQ9X7E6_9EUKA|nr:putative Aldo-keto reductase family 1 member A1 [Blattamonas nauphoetae]